MVDLVLLQSFILNIFTFPSTTLTDPHFVTDGEVVTLEAMCYKSIWPLRVSNPRPSRY